MKFYLLLILLVTFSITMALEDTTELAEKEFKSYLLQIKNGKIDEAMLCMFINQKEVEEIFNDKAPKAKISEMMEKMKEYQPMFKAKLPQELNPKLTGTAELTVKATKIENVAVNEWLKENVAIYKLFVTYPDGTKAGTNTVIIFDKKFKFIRGFDSLPEMIKTSEDAKAKK